MKHAEWSWMVDVTLGAWASPLPVTKETCSSLHQQRVPQCPLRPREREGGCGLERGREASTAKRAGSDANAPRCIHSNRKLCFRCGRFGCIRWIQFKLGRQADVGCCYMTQSTQDQFRARLRIWDGVWLAEPWSHIFPLCCNFHLLSIK